MPPLTAQSRKRRPAYLPYFLGLLPLLVSIYAGWRLVRHPVIGLDWTYHTGLIHHVDPTGPATGLVEVNDIILTIDGIPVEQAHYAPSRRPGEELVLLIQQGGEQHRVVLHLVRPAPREIVSRLAPLGVGLAFWAIGGAVLAFSTAERRQALLFFAFFQGVALTIATGAISAIDYHWAQPLFSMLLWCMGPLALSFHLSFPFDRPLKWARPVVNTASLIALVGSLLTLTGVWQSLGMRWSPLAVSNRLWLALCLAGVVALLGRGILLPGGEPRAGIVTLGGGTALLGFVCLSVLPHVLLGIRVPYEVTFLLLLLIPISYGYAVLRHRLITLDRYLNRSVSLLLVLILLAGVYSAGYAGLRLLLPAPVWEPALNLTFVLACAGLTLPLYRTLQRVVDRLAYGTWYDYRLAVQAVSSTLDLRLGPVRLALVLARRIREVMGLDFVYFLVPDERGWWPVGVSEQPDCTIQDSSQPIPLNDPLVLCLQQAADSIRHDVLRIGLQKGGTLSALAAQLAACPVAEVWIPLQPGGALVAGAKRGDSLLNAQDLDILSTIARQIGIALQNAWLVNELQHKAAETARLHWQVLRAREDERKRVARDLHDDVIQSLAGLNFQLFDLRRRLPANLQDNVSALRDNVQTILGDVRRVCADLRPPTLDSFGLIPALRDRIREINHQTSFAIRLHYDDGADRDLPEATALVAYRFVQEALYNVQKHAAATEVDVSITRGSDQLQVLVVDNGQGFVVPDRLGQFIGDGHFGLVGLRERLEAVDGRLEVRSAPGQGSQLLAIIPLDQGPGSDRHQGSEKGEGV